MQSGGGKSNGGGEDDFNPEEMYDRFPPGEDLGYGRDAGYGELVQINLRKWFTDEAQRDPVINAFLEAGEGEKVAFSYLQVKSSSRESEWYIHKPHLVLSGDEEKTGIAGTAPGFVRGQHIGTYVINHHRTLALRPVRAMVVSDGSEVGQIVHKGDGS
jgi:hypothetical protein